MSVSIKTFSQPSFLTKLVATEGVTVFAALAVLIAATSIIAPAFLTLGNIQNVLVQSIFLVILGIGMTYVLISGGIDLSVGSTMGLSAAVCLVSLNNGIPFPFCILLALVTGAIVGALNAYFITVLGIADFIVTLAMMSFVRGIVELMTASQEYDSRLPAFQYLAGGAVFGIPFPVIIALVVTAAAGLVLARTSTGRTIYAAGLSPPCFLSCGRQGQSRSRRRLRILGGDGSADGDSAGVATVF